jgi:hypothetical protein
MSKLKIVINISKGSSLTGNAWADILLGGERVVEKAEISAAFDYDPNEVIPDRIELSHEYDANLI